MVQEQARDNADVEAARKREKNVAEKAAAHAERQKKRLAAASKGVPKLESFWNKEK